jgi:hypothetical protein
MIELPCFGIRIFLKWDKDVADSMQGTIESDLHDGNEHNRYNAMIDVIESIILAHCIAGINVESPAYIEGIETAVNAIENNI